ncbi:MAG: hypothetical protein ACOX6Z_06155, partial [Dethiobacteria bacterium]
MQKWCGRISLRGGLNCAVVLQRQTPRRTGGELDRQQEVKASLFYSCPREQERSAAPFCTGSERLERLWG